MARIAYTSDVRRFAFEVPARAASFSFVNYAIFSFQQTASR
jgi:hypothetical protein